jgi:hypothetical protein
MREYTQAILKTFFTTYFFETAHFTKKGRSRLIFR